MARKPRSAPNHQRSGQSLDVPPSIVPDLLEQRGAAAASNAAADINLKFGAPIADAVRRSLTRAPDGGSDGEIYISADAVPDPNEAIDLVVKKMRRHLYGKGKGSTDVPNDEKA